VGGGLGTLNTIISTLEKQRPVVVMADSGGVCKDLYTFLELDGGLPTFNDKLTPGTEEYKRDRSNIETLRSKLPYIKELGLKRHGANKAKQISFFKAHDDVEGVGNELDDVILKAVLSDVDSTFEAIQHAVKWGESTIIDYQLQESKNVDTAEVTKAFQTALVLAARDDDNALKVVETLIDYNADCRLVQYDKLWRTENPAEPENHGNRVEDAFSVIAEWQEESKTRASSFDGQLRSVLSLGFFKGSRDKVQPGAPVSANWMDQSLSRRFHYRVDGFDILENSSLMDNDFLGYAAHLKCQRTIALLQQAAYKDGRYHHGRQPTLSARDDLLCCSWTDLMMWAVLVDQENLAWLLWKKTLMPMRAAIMAARVMQRIEDKLDKDEQEADVQSARYERWAIETLKRVPTKAAAKALLTALPKKKIPGPGAYLPLWRDSVMDQACSTEYPCRDFVAQSHCQFLLDEYYHGDFCTSRAKIDRGVSQGLVILQAFLHLFHLLTLGVLRNAIPNFVTVHRVHYHAEEEDEEPDDDDAMEYDEDEASEWLRFDSSRWRL